MIFRQLFDESTWTYTYLIADESTGEAVLIDPVLEKVPLYRKLLRELSLQIIYAIDTHVHADHITALGALREEYGCLTVHGEGSEAACVSKFVADREILKVGKLELEAISTPGHTSDSYCFVLKTDGPAFLFSGDTLLIRGTGRTDFQNGDAALQFDSLKEKILTLPNDTILYPGHDYQGMTQSTIGEEKLHNPRLQVADKKAYIKMMRELDLPNPKFMDVAVPANLKCGDE